MKLFFGKPPTKTVLSSKCFVLQRDPLVLLRSVVVHSHSRGGALHDRQYTPQHLSKEMSSLQPFGVSTWMWTPSRFTVPYLNAPKNYKAPCTFDTRSRKSLRVRRRLICTDYFYFIYRTLTLFKPDTKAHVINVYSAPLLCQCGAGARKKQASTTPSRRRTTSSTTVGSASCRRPSRW